MLADTKHDMGMIQSQLAMLMGDDDGDVMRSTDREIKISRYNMTTPSSPATSSPARAAPGEMHEDPQSVPEASTKDANIPHVDIHGPPAEQPLEGARQRKQSSLHDLERIGCS